MRKWIAAILAVLCAATFTGCGSTKDTDITTIAVGKDGSLTSTIVEEFEKEYYDAEDLKEYTLDAVAAFNAAGTDRDVSVSKVEEKDGTVVLQMKYPNADNYSEFNGKVFFAGTIAEAYDSGMDLDVTLQDVTDESKSAGKSDILQMGEKKIVILQENVAVEVPGKLLYASNGTEIMGAKRAIAHPGNGLSYLIYK